MPSMDARRWDARYRASNGAPELKPHSLLVEHRGSLPAHGRALDLAMGRGNNAGWLLGQNLRVVGVDISTVAVRLAKERWPALMAVVADLTTLPLPPCSFDVILNFYYLDRTLWPLYAHVLRPGGVLIFETFTHARLTTRPHANPSYLLAPQELLAAFSGTEWSILTYREAGMDAAGRPQATASLVARRS